jgi:hypothetical protein
MIFVLKKKESQIGKAHPAISEPASANLKTKLDQQQEILQVVQGLSQVAELVKGKGVSKGANNEIQRRNNKWRCLYHNVDKHDIDKCRSR